MKKIKDTTKPLLLLIPIGVFLFLFPKNIFITITAGLIMIGASIKFSQQILFYFALVLFMSAPILQILELEKYAETAVDFAFFFILGAIINELIFTKPSKRNNSKINDKTFKS